MIPVAAGNRRKNREILRPSPDISMFGPDAMKYGNDEKTTIMSIKYLKVQICMNTMGKYTILPISTVMFRKKKWYFKIFRINVCS